MAADDVGLEGANTSFQVHLRVDPDQFAAHFNAAQLATGPVLAVAGNSPTFLGHRLWQETRVFLQAGVDDRDAAGRSSRRLSRVAFGTGWMRTGPLELLEESVRLHEPVLPVVGPEQPLALLEAGECAGPGGAAAPPGTVWRWNRAIYDPADGGHLRIEMRALPSGPTVTDMLANAAFILGLTLALAPDAPAMVRRFAFQQAHHNFYRAAQFGLAELAWPPASKGRARTPAAELDRHLLPPPARAWRTRRARRGGGPAPLGHPGPGGQRPDRRRLAAPGPGRTRAEAGPRARPAAMLEHYLEHQRTGEPVHTWPLPQAR